MSLKVSINSISLKRGYPEIKTEHGGGHVFDLRCLPNPGREEEYKTKTGKDADVANYLEEHPEVQEYRRLIFSLIDKSIENYQSRGFTDLAVSFGCTGGQHRSVYFAECLAKHLASKENVEFELTHREIG